jgi:hypothetical protein
MNDVLRQELSLTPLSDKYQIERWYRCDRNPGKYVSFSQMINDAIDDTDAEFMIFCNPKTHFVPEDIEFIINKLSNGYCFVSLVSFGFFGFSKELIRRIGMFDERFIGGEYEDDDFSIRLGIFGKASWIEYRSEKYETHNVSRSGTFRHLSGSIFLQKYHIDGNKILVDQNFFTHKKISKRHRNTKQYIYDSWKDSIDSYGETKMARYSSEYSFESIKPEIKEILAFFNFKIDRRGEDFKVELLSEVKMNLRFVFLSDINTREIIWADEISSNSWKTMWIFYPEDIEVRIFMDDNQIFTSTLDREDSLDLKFKLPKIIKT